MVRAFVEEARLLLSLDSPIAPIPVTLLVTLGMNCINIGMFTRSMLN